jgi:hypothetical protein
MGAPHGVAADAEGDARRFFEQASAARDAGRMQQARDLLRRSLATFPTTAAAFNLTRALDATGELVDAVRTLERLVEGQFGALSEAERRVAEQALAETRSRVPELHVTVRGAAIAEVAIDDHTTRVLRDGESLRESVDPGQHVVTARAPGLRTAREVVTLEERARNAIVLVLAAADESVGSEPERLDRTRGHEAAVSGSPDRPDDSDGGGTAWIWIVAGAAVVIAGGVAVTLFLLGSDDDEGTVLPTAEALRF